MLDLDGLRFSIYRFSLEAEDRFHIPGYPGFILRGAFGAKLKRICCVSRGRECSDCVLHTGCPYAYLFETVRFEGAPKFRTIRDIPRPFVISPLPSDDPASLKFDFTLIGDAVEAFPYVLSAFIELEKSGIGPKRDRFSLLSVDSITPQGSVNIYRKQEVNSPFKHYLFTHLDLLRRAEEINDNKVKINLLSPLRTKFRGQLVSDLMFHHLVRAILRRLSLICAYHCGFKLNLDFTATFSMAEKVKRRSSKLRWIDMERFSTRQKRRLKIGGVMGYAGFEGEIAPFRIILAAGEKLHAGKGCVMGLGKMEVMDDMEGSPDRDGGGTERGEDQTDEVVSGRKTGG
ncbi:CRISPR system precrRNA processing endoribonuclease RAMP protein Cas6 [Candidatus Poribacteria bacterium]|nr:CRISPR system precrRNA processing endoribonuclease RAMP protein Cas6 [Candidatus Poribacteria bacterium]